LNKSNANKAVLSGSIDASSSDRLVTIHTIKPGHYVNGKVTKVLENGIEIKFLSGLLGTMFADHMVGTFKNGAKVQARVISVDPALKRISLSMQPHILEMKTDTKSLAKIGQTFNDVKVEKIVFGSSFHV